MVTGYRAGCMPHGDSGLTGTAAEHDVGHVYSTGDIRHRGMTSGERLLCGASAAPCNVLLDTWHNPRRSVALSGTRKMIGTPVTSGADVDTDARLVPSDNHRSPARLRACRGRALGPERLSTFPGDGHGGSKARPSLRSAGRNLISQCAGGRENVQLRPWRVRVRGARDLGWERQVRRGRFNKHISGCSVLTDDHAPIACGVSVVTRLHGLLGAR
ncbi:hypothetical protein L226DRAFT_263882 [Lentinus tigrinus ALCF2SS1-7]|uniref:uncharacterized protein n=1 Tax=Lentinus tigrinus ALCF2SS1-7 TaxID=1328758 RepID=UPI001165D9BC|nr:hypothetical protein L226DRAFT_263882 [Lentinus tigrinus ALCF2SS1-7]